VSTLISILTNEINENQFKILLEVNLSYNSYDYGQTRPINQTGCIAC